MHYVHYSRSKTLLYINYQTPIIAHILDAQPPYFIPNF